MCPESSEYAWADIMSLLRIAPLRLSGLGTMRRQLLRGVGVREW
jgi:hypothetical protein